MKKAMTQKQYVKSDGVRCPYCNGGNIEGESVEIDAGGASQEVRCLDCDKAWLDVYKLTGYLPVGS